MYRSTLLLIGSLIALGAFIALSGSPRQAQSGGAADEAANAKLAESQSKAGETVDPDEQLLKDAGVKTDGASLVAFLHKHSASEADLRNLDQLIGQLGSRSFREREQASKQLVTTGAPALPALQRAIRDPDPEVLRRGMACLKEIGRSLDTGLQMACARLLVRRRIDAAAEALLRYLPSAAGEELMEEIVCGLDTLAVHKGRLEPSLSAALQDTLPARRAAAACIVGRVGDADQRAGVRKLLNDPEPLVRLRAAQGLLCGKDMSGIAVLIALLSDPSVELSWQAEELLHWIAGDSAPSLTVGAGNADSAKSCRTAWERWWRRYCLQPDLLKSDQDYRRPGLLLVGDCDMSKMNGKRLRGRIRLFGCDGKARWQLENVGDPWDVQLLSGNRILIAEGGNVNRVTERDLEGRVLWSEKVAEDRTPVACRRLSNGNTFIATCFCVQEVGPDGKEIYSHDLRQVGLAIYSAQKLASGHIVCSSMTDGSLLELDGATGRELRKVISGKSSKMRCQAEALPGGCFLVTMVNRDKLVQVDATGKIVWECTVPSVTWATRLCNGNTLAACGSAADGRLVEIDSTGKRVWEVSLEGSLCCVRVCLRLLRLGLGRARSTNLDLDSMSQRVKGLKDKDVLVRRRSVSALGKLGPNAETAIPALIEALSDTDAEVRHLAGDALVSIGTTAIPALAKMLKAANTQTRLESAFVLGTFRHRAQVAVPELLPALKDDSAAVRRQAAITLGLIGPGGKAAVPALISALNDEDIEVCRCAARSLGLIGPGARAAVPELIRAMKSKDAQLGSWAAGALGMIGPTDKAVIPALTNALKDKQYVAVRDWAAWALGRIGPEAKAAIPELIEALELKDVKEASISIEIRRSSVWALGQMGPEGKAAVPVLIEILKDKQMDPTIREAAAEALGKVGSDDKESLAVLTESQEDSNTGVSTAASRAIERIRVKK